MAALSEAAYRGADVLFHQRSHVLSSFSKCCSGPVSHLTCASSRTTPSFHPPFLQKSSYYPPRTNLQSSVARGYTRTRRRCIASQVTANVDTSAAPSKSRTRQIMEKLAGRNAETGGAGGAVSYEALQRADAGWARVRNMKTGSEAGPAPEVVRRRKGGWKTGVTLDEEMFDVVVCGGTLGVFFATALVARGKRVAIVERGELRGRAQEWNISRKELASLVEQRVLTEAELQDAISVEFNPTRAGFHQGTEVLVNDILNVGISPDKVIQAAKERFVQMGGWLLERTGLQSVEVFDDGAVLKLEGQQQKAIVTRLVLDGMGHASPIVRYGGARSQMASA